MNSMSKNLAEVPTSANRTPSLASRVPKLSQTPRSTSKIPMNTQSRFSNKFTPKTPSLNTPTSRFLSTTNSARSINTPMSRSVNQVTKTPSHRPPTTPSSNRFASAKTGPTINSHRAPLTKTPSTFRSNLNSRLTNPSNFHTPSRRPTLMDQKKLSRTVDCAKSIKRRSIKLLNQSTSRLSFLNDMESGCVLMTPKLFQHLINKDKIDEAEEKLNDEDLKVRTIDPDNLLKYLLKDKAKTESENKSIKLEIVVNVNSPSSGPNQPVQLNLDTDKLESMVNDQTKAELRVSSEKCKENQCVEKSEVANDSKETCPDGEQAESEPNEDCKSQDSAKLNEPCESDVKSEKKCEKVEELCHSVNGEEHELAKETKNADFTIPFEPAEEDEKDDGVLECKEISIQTDFNDSVVNGDCAENSNEKKEEIVRLEDKGEEKSVENEVVNIEEKRDEELAEVPLVKSKRGRKPKQNNENDCAMTKGKRGRKAKDTAQESSQDKVSSGQRVLTRAQRAKLATKN